MEHGLSVQTNDNDVELRNQNIDDPNLKTNFWDVNGYKKTLNRLQNAELIGKNLDTALCERINIEKSYSTQLRRWSEKWSLNSHQTNSFPHIDYGTAQKAWLSFCNESRELSNIHKSIADNITTLPLATLRRWQEENVHAPLPTGLTFIPLPSHEFRIMERDFQEAHQEWAESWSNMERSRDNYYACCLKIDELQDQLKSLSLILNENYDLTTFRDQNSVRDSILSSAEDDLDNENKDSLVQGNSLMSPTSLVSNDGGDGEIKLPEGSHITAHHNATYQTSPTNSKDKYRTLQTLQKWAQKKTNTLLSQSSIGGSKKKDPEYQMYKAKTSLEATELSKKDCLVAYKRSIETLKSNSERYMERMNKVYDKCQVREKDRIDFFKQLFAQIHQSLDISQFKKLPEIYTELQKEMNVIDTDADLEWWDTNKGRKMPFVLPEFEEYDRYRKVEKLITTMRQNWVRTLSDTQKRVSGTLRRSKSNAPRSNMSMISASSKNRPKTLLFSSERSKKTNTERPASKNKFYFAPFEKKSTTRPVNSCADDGVNTTTVITTEADGSTKVITTTKITSISPRDLTTAEKH